MKYNLFRASYWNGKRWTDDEIVNDKPLTHDEAMQLKRHYIGYPIGSYQFLCNQEYIIQGIYEPTREAFEQFLDDNGWEEYGQSYSSFCYAMEENEIYRP